MLPVLVAFSLVATQPASAAPAKPAHKTHKTPTHKTGGAVIENISALTDVTATPGNGSIAVGWDVTPDASDVDHFRVWAQTVEDDPTIVACSPNPASTARSCTISGLTNGTEYRVFVRAADSEGIPLTADVEPEGSPFVPTNPPGPPTGLEVAARHEGLLASWTAPTNTGDGIESYTASAVDGDEIVQSTCTTEAPSQVSCLIPDLLDDTTYSVNVVAHGVHNSGDSDPSDPVSGTPSEPPGAPTDVLATAGNKQVTVLWTAPETVGEGIENYTATAYVGDDELTDPVKSCSTADDTHTSCTVTGLTNGTEYRFRVVANAVDGNVSDRSDDSDPVTPGPSDAPSNVVAHPGNASAEVTWDAPTNTGAGIRRYRVTSSPGGKTCQTPTADPPHACTVSELTNGTSYTFTVVAVGFGGTSPASSPSEAVTPGPPGAPSVTSVTAGKNEVTVHWSAPTNAGSGITGYTATAYVDGEVTDPLHECSVDEDDDFSCTVEGLTGGTTYTFKVVAHGIEGIGDGPASAESDEVKPGPPDAPTITHAQAGDHEVTVTWTKPENKGAGIAGYAVSAYVGDELQDHSCVTVDEDELSCTVAELDNTMTYTFTVVAKGVDETGDSAASDPSDPVMPGPPGAPTLVKVVPGIGEATVYWDEPDTQGAGIESYTVYRSRDPVNVAVAENGSVAGNGHVTENGHLVACTTTSLSCVVQNLEDGVEYTFYVVANGVDDSGRSAHSNESDPVRPGVPDMPTGVELTPGDGSLLVEWTAPSHQNAGVLWYTAMATPGGNSCSTPDGETTSCTIIGLSGGVTYSVMVRANTIGGNASSWTSPVQSMVLSPSIVGRSVRNANGTLQTFVIGPDGTLWTNIQSVDGIWAGWATLGGTSLVGEPVAVRNANGKLHVFARDSLGQVWQRQQTSAGGDSWTDWGSLGCCMTSIGLEVNANGKIELFGVGTNKILYHRLQSTAGGTAWGDWLSLGGQSASAVTVTRLADGRLQVYELGLDNQYWYRLQTAVNGTTWTEWSHLTTPTSLATNLV
jgi:titin